MECPLAFFDRHVESISEDFLVAVVWQLQIIHARHHAGEVIIWRVRGFAGSTDNREDWR